MTALACKFNLRCFRTKDESERRRFAHNDALFYTSKPQRRHAALQGFKLAAKSRRGGGRAEMKNNRIEIRHRNYTEALAAGGGESLLAHSQPHVCF